MKRPHKISMLLFIAVSLVACDQPSSTPVTGGTSVQVAQAGTTPRPKKDFAAFMQGGSLFRKNCAQCHGNLAQGGPNWRQANSKGKMPPPPLNGTGHTWHHSKTALAQTIRNGTLHIGGSMPPWRSTMTDKEIDMTIDWFQSRWSDEIYKAWQTRNPQPKGR